MVATATRALSFNPYPVERIGRLLASWPGGRPCNEQQEVWALRLWRETGEAIATLEAYELDLVAALEGRWDDPVYSEYRRKLELARDRLRFLREWRAEMSGVLWRQCCVRAA